MQLCGRPTRTGLPCRRPLLWFETACNVHATPDERDQALQKLRSALVAKLTDEEPCACPCHASVHPGLIPCPKCPTR